MREGIRGGQGEGNGGVCVWLGRSSAQKKHKLLYIYTTASYLHSVMVCIQQLLPVII